MPPERTCRSVERASAPAHHILQRRAPSAAPALFDEGLIADQVRFRLDEFYGVGSRLHLYQMALPFDL